MFSSLVVFNLVFFVLLVLWVRVFGGPKMGSKIVKNGPRVWAFCKIEFPGIQKPVQILDQKSGFFRNPGNRGVGVIWRVRGGVSSFVSFVVLFMVFVLGLCFVW